MRLRRSAHGTSVGGWKTLRDLICTLPWPQGLSNAESPSRAQEHHGQPISLDPLWLVTSAEYKVCWLNDMSNSLPGEQPGAQTSDRFWQNEPNHPLAQHIALLRRAGVPAFLDGFRSPPDLFRLSCVVTPAFIGGSERNGG